jgi:hypothetical protein
MPDLADIERAAWTALSAATGVSYRGTTLVRGPGAREVSEALLSLGSSTVIAEEAALDADHSDPPDDAVDTVILLHAWPAPDEAADAAKAATDWLRPGGWLVMADLDIKRLQGAPLRLYPSALLYQMFPSVREHLAARCTSAIGLVTSAVRAGLDGKVTTSIDRPLGVYASASEFRAAVEFGSWRGLEQLSGDDYGHLLDGIAAIDVGRWPLVEVEPWICVAGTARV